MTSEAIQGTVVTATAALGATVQATAACPAGRAVLGGGGWIGNANVGQGVALYESTPAPAPGVPTGWSVRAIQTNAGAGNWNVRAFAICGPVPAP